MAKILIIQTAFIGDALLSLALIKNLRRIYPESEIQLLCRKGIGSLFRDLQLVEQVYEIDKGSYQRGISNWETLLRTQFDLLVCVHQSFRSQWLSRQLKAKHKIGYREWWNFFIFNERYSRPMEFPEVLRQLALLQGKSPEVVEFFAEEADAFKNVQTRKGPVDFSSLRLPDLIDGSLDWSRLNGSAVERSASLKVSDFLRAHRIDPMRTFFVAPGSVWATKRWRKEHFVALLKQFATQNYFVVLVGSPDERQLCEEITAEVPQAINSAGQFTLFESLFLYKQGLFMISNDSGAMHLAVLAGLPVVGIFGPTTLNLGYRPWSDKALVVQRELSCRPCGKHGHIKCPIGTHACMVELDPAEVLRQIQSAHFLNI